MDKSPGAFRTISEVAAELDLPQHVLRFWETRFAQIKPLKRGGGRRYYRPDDVDLLAGIRKLLYGEGYTIKGVQRLLKENGVHWVINVGRGIESGAPSGSMHEDDEPAPAQSEPAVKPQPAPTRTAVLVPERATAEPAGADAAVAMRSGAQAIGPALPTAPALAPNDEPLPRDVLAEETGGEPQRASFRLIDRLRGEPRGAEEGEKKMLAKDDVRRLQATLFELLECKRVLDQAR
ncbi:MerR family transcriptional regulator [Breoghania sp.]|uniref:MerR family transcriptional regulator n=1 Tax=Breoghania sp. TaxID=2065378 RepID=UPI00320474F2